MYVCPIYNADGIQVNQIEIDDDIEHVNGRVSKGKTHYYKGIGAPYHSHYARREAWNIREYDLIETTDVFYLGDQVSKKCFAGKAGIFEEKYQPQFSDQINSCGVKELAIIENSMFFERSSVELIKSHRIDTDRYYFALNYKCGRRNYLQDGDPAKLRELISYMLAANWNFIWDKNVITDITYNGLVSDVADIFYSKELEHKIGTVYSILYSLCGKNPYYYRLLMDQYHLGHANQKSFIYNTLMILQQNGVAVEHWLDDFNDAAYRDIVLNQLVVGRNCGHCSAEGLGEEIKNTYVAQTQHRWTTQNYC